MPPCLQPRVAPSQRIAENLARDTTAARFPTEPEKCVRKRDRACVADQGRQLAFAVLLATLVAHVSQLPRLAEPIRTTLCTVAPPMHRPEIAENIRAAKEPRLYVIDLHGIVSGDLRAADTADHGNASG